MRHDLVSLAAVLVASTTAGQVRTLPPAPAARSDQPPQPEVVVVFQGGDYPANVTRVLLELHRLGALPTAEYVVGPGQGICDVYRLTGLPGGCPQPETDQLARSLNSFRSISQLRIGQKVVAPRVEIKERPYIVKLDPKVGSDQKLLHDLGTHWKGALKKTESLPDGYQRLTFAGYQINVPLESDDEARRALAGLRGLRLPNVVVTAAYASPQVQKYHWEESDQYWADCLARGALPAQEVSLARLVTSLPPEPCSVTCRDRDCPDVILIDTQLLSNPGLPGCDSTSPPSGDLSALKCRAGEIDPQVHHGTYLAGIVDANGNGLGVKGVMPGLTKNGLSAGQVLLRCLDRTRTPEHAIINFIEQRDAEGGLPIYLYASDWPVGDGQHLIRESDRFDQATNPLGAKIKDLWPLFIAAAGDGDPEISRQFPKSPMNLGDQRNVIIVTACEDCMGASPRLLTGANRGATGQPMVHLAAPGKEVVSTASATEYGRASGTSPAAAFVAGVAAAMKACYPSLYQRAYVVKTRLQLAARPFPPAPGAARPDDGVTSGILDAEAALLAPDSDWLRQKGGAWKRIRAKKWLRTFELLHPRTQQLASGYLRLGDVQRLKRFPGSADGQPEQWTAYAQVRSSLGEVQRFGPGIMTGEGPILELCDGDQLPPKDVDDLLLKAPLGLARPCS